jgi:exodeoxyribonuclease VII large subunit
VLFRSLRALAPTVRLAKQRARFAHAANALRRALPQRLADRRAALAGLAGRLDSLSPLAVLSRGYAIVRRERDGAILRAAEQVTSGERVRIRLSEGEIAARVEREADS